MSREMLKNPRREDRKLVFSFSLTEILVLMVFVAVAFAFYSKDEGLQLIDSVRKDNEELRDSLAHKDEVIKNQKAKINDLEQRRAFWKDFVSRMIGNKVLKDPREKGSKEKLEGMYKSHLKKIGCGTGYPRCKVTKGILLSLYIRGDGALDVTAGWKEDRREAVSQVPGLMQLIAKKTVTLDEFSRYAEGIFKWGDSQETACRFHVDASSMAPNLGAEFVTKRMRVIDKYFYPRRY